MARNQIIGRVIAVSPITEVPSKEQGKPAIKKRELYMDCTRIDYYTHQPIGQENKVVLEFGGDKVLDKIAALSLQRDDVVAVEFNIVGTPYKDKQTGKNKVFTSIRCYDVEVLQRAGTQQAAPAPQPQPQPQTAPAPASAPVQGTQDNNEQGDGLPF